MSFISQTILDSIKSLGSSSSNKNSGIMTEEKCKKVVECFIESKKIIGENKMGTAMALITGLGQNGCSNKNIGTITFTIGNYTASNVDLNSAITSVEKNATPRQFFRGIANEVQQIAVILNEPGDLARIMKREYPHITMEEQTWCSNFQTYNPFCPTIVREWLIKNRSEKFNSKN